jgi:hypothetical protein
MRVTAILAIVGPLVVLGAFSGCIELSGFSSGGLPSDGGLGSSSSSGSAGTITLPDGAVVEAGNNSTSSGVTDGGNNPDTGPSGPHCQITTNAASSTMVRVMTEKYCIDTTEVTNDQYIAFLAAKFPVPAICSWKTDYHGTSFTGNGAVGNVDWCDAYSFCQYAGKRLCGSRTGKILDRVNSISIDSEWQFACTHGGNPDYTYPYGSVVNPQICLYGDNSPAHSRPVAADDRCTGPAGVFDLSGNVWEWEDACDRTTPYGANMDCNLRGGGFLRVSADWGKCTDAPGGWPRESFTDDTGIRCCADYK